MSYPRARASSPTNTNFSGISNYRSESYRPIRGGEVPAVPQIDSKKVARVHFEELQSFLSSHLARGEPECFMHFGNRASEAKALTWLMLFQSRQIQERVLGKSSLGSPASNSRNYPQMCTMSSFGETLDQKVSYSTCNVVHISSLHRKLQPRTCRTGMTFTPNAIKHDKNCRHYQSRDSRIWRPTCTLSLAEDIQSSKNPRCVAAATFIRFSSNTEHFLAPARYSRICL